MFLLTYFVLFYTVHGTLNKDDFLVVSVIHDQNDVYHRFVRSLNIFGFKHQNYGLDQNWANQREKIEILRKNLSIYKENKNQIILFTNTSDVIFDQGIEFLLNKFETLRPARIVVSGDNFCSPEKFQNDYPSVEQNEKRFLNAAVFIGYASDVYDLLSSEENIDNLQLFFTEKFLDEKSRAKWSILVDKRADLILNLDDAIDQIELPVHADEVYVKNTWTDSIPALVHANDRSRKHLNYLSNYIAQTWSISKGCLQSKENRFDLIHSDLELTQWPVVYIAMFIEYPTPFLREYFEKLIKITYPKKRLAILIHNRVEYHENFVKETLKTFQQDEYIFIKQFSMNNEAEARQQSIRECQNDRCDYLFVVDSIVHLNHPDTLIELISLNRTIVAPMLLRPGQAWSNFWGAINEQGFYQRSPDYLDFVNYKKMGLFNVPHVAHCYLINGTFLQRFTPTFINQNVDPDIQFSQSVRESGFFMYVTNELNYGHLIDPENFNISRIQPELYEIFNNVKDWKSRYLHPDYHKSLEPNATIEQPCPDVFWFPMMSEEFTRSLVNLMETYGQWSGASHRDSRLAGGYENVPTDDIHLTQVDFQEHWLFILRDIVQPIQQKVFTGYYNDPPRAALNFVVRYMPELQNKLRPHHDASIYTLNLALNDAGIDFEGGGCRFIRQNCSVVKTRRGWALMQPGRLTHLHEGLPVTKGKRYIMISFIDP